MAETRHDQPERMVPRYPQDGAEDRWSARKAAAFVIIASLALWGLLFAALDWLAS